MPPTGHPPGTKWLTIWAISGENERWIAGTSLDGRDCQRVNPTVGWRPRMRRPRTDDIGREPDGWRPRPDERQLQHYSRDRRPVTSDGSIAVATRYAGAVQLSETVSNRGIVAASTGTEERFDALRFPIGDGLDQRSQVRSRRGRFSRDGTTGRGTSCCSLLLGARATSSACRRHRHRQRVALRR